MMNKTKLLLEDHTLPCLQFVGFCEPLLKKPYNISWFPEKLCYIFHISGFIGSIIKVNESCCL